MARSKLTEEQKETIRMMHDTNGYPFDVLAEQYGVSIRTIQRICNPEYYEKQKEANRLYQKNNYKKIKERKQNNYSRYQLVLHKNNDANIISKLDEQESVNGYIKTLINKDIAESEPEDE